MVDVCECGTVNLGDILKDIAFYSRLKHRLLRAEADLWQLIGRVDNRFCVQRRLIATLVRIVKRLIPGQRLAALVVLALLNLVEIN